MYQYYANSRVKKQINTFKQLKIKIKKKLKNKM